MKTTIAFFLAMWQQKCVAANMTNLFTAGCAYQTLVFELCLT